MGYSDFRHAVSSRLTDVLSVVPPFSETARDSELFQEFIAPAVALSSGGKRTRALCVAGGFEAISRQTQNLPLHAAVAIELYQASALVHDDIIDDAETRRGIPAPHRLFAAQHEQLGFIGEAALFGQHSGVLLGDYLLSCGGEEFAKQDAPDGAFRRAFALFNEMASETAFGQYMDMRAEFTPLSNDADCAVDDAFLVLLHKSARYSIELPVLIGVALAGGDDDAAARLTLFTRPLGEAFQLRDDELGIFGDPAVTGKPAGSDISEGKRTVLLALTRQMCTQAERTFIDQRLGNAVSDTDLAEIQAIMRSSGAFERHETFIRDREDRAREHMPEHATILRDLACSLTERRF